MGIEQKTVGMLIDELITVNIKCYMKIDELHLSEGERAGQVAVEIHKLNNRRNQLMAAIDRLLGFGDITVTEKTYKDLK